MAVLWLMIITSFLNAQSSSACRTSIGIPCYTMEMKHSQWTLFSDGITDIRHGTSSSLFAVRRDGSHVGWGREANGKLSIAGMYLAPSDQVVKVNHPEKTISYREVLIWHDRPYRRSTSGDAECVTGLIHYGSSSQFTRAGTDKIAGVPVVKWTRGNGLLWSEEIYMAPELDCAVLKHNQRHFQGWFGKGYILATEATSVRIGEPAAEIFALPAGYQQVEDPQRTRLQQFVRSNGH